jgi:hypothetical protein
MCVYHATWTHINNAHHKSLPSVIPTLKLPKLHCFIDFISIPTNVFFLLVSDTKITAKENWVISYSQIFCSSDLKVSGDGKSRWLLCSWTLSIVLRPEDGDRTQFPKCSVLRKKQDGFLDKDKTMDNVQEHSNHILVLRLSRIFINWNISFLL